MNILNKYSSHTIAAIGTLFFFGLFILLLFMKPFGDSTSANPDDLADAEVPIQFQKDLSDDIPLPPPPANSQNTSVESVTDNQSKYIPSAQDVDEEPQSEDVGTTTAKKDSILIAEIKMEIVDIKNILPEDTIKKNQITQKDIQQFQQTLANTTRNTFEDRKFIYDNYRAIMSFKKVYPYVQKTKEVIIRLNSQLAKMKNNNEKRLLIKQTEKELYAQFEKDVRNMSTSQGKLLLKLIARETNQTAYGLIKTYKGVVPATFWYGVGLIFHENMKAQYDSIGEDAQLEKIVQKYKLGKL